MAELAQAEVYAPRTSQLWRTLLNWLAFFFQIFVQMVRGTPSMAQILSFLGLGHHHHHHSLLSSNSPSFKPLPVSELPELKEPPASAAVRITGGGVDTDGSDDHRPIERLTVVLDLDETLVCAYETFSLPAIVRNQAIEAGLKWFELECISSDKECEGKPKINYVTVFERPGLQEFLKQLSEFADLVLFTAGLEGFSFTDIPPFFPNNPSILLYIFLKSSCFVCMSSSYARPLVDRIDVENHFTLRLYRTSTISTEYREHVKDLCCLSKDLCRTVIVDNNPFSFLLQPVNGIPCIPFSAGQPHDEQLLDILLPLLRHLAEQKDVRPVLYERFRMPEWFQRHGIPCSCWTK